MWGSFIPHSMPVYPGAFGPTPNLKSHDPKSPGLIARFLNRAGQGLCWSMFELYHRGFRVEKIPCTYLPKYTLDMDLEQNFQLQYRNSVISVIVVTQIMFRGRCRTLDDHGEQSADFG